ncbi:MAG: alpha-L-arabinofuranosidase C-terminal domain-containing protein, partial [Terracidiphilus sp.]
GMQWPSDLIGYDTIHSYGSPSYWAQVMFGSYLGDQTLKSEAEGAGGKFFYSITKDSAKKELYLKLVNASSVAQPVTIDLSGAKVASTAKLVSLSAPDTQATNSIDDPERIIPVGSTVQVSSQFSHTLPPFSIQVVQLDEQ